jgi:hypothetical protein
MTMIAFLTSTLFSSPPKSAPKTSGSQPGTCGKTLGRKELGTAGTSSDSASA